MSTSSDKSASDVDKLTVESQIDPFLTKGHSMKSIFLALVVMISSNFVQAQTWDAVGVFHQQDKVIVQINEPLPSERLQWLLDTAGDGNSWLHLSEDKTFKASCQRGTYGITCIFRFLPPAGSVFTDKKASAVIPAEFNETASWSFLNSNGDHFHIETTPIGLHLSAGKKNWAFEGPIVDEKGDAFGCFQQLTNLIVEEADGPPPNQDSTRAVESNTKIKLFLAKRDNAFDGILGGFSIFANFIVHVNFDETDDLFDHTCSFVSSPDRH